MFEIYSIQIQDKTIFVAEDVYRAYNQLEGTMRVGRQNQTEKDQSKQEHQKDMISQLKQISEVLMSLPSGFSGTLVAHMKRLNISRKQLEMNSLVSDSTIKRMRTSDRDFELDHVIAICIGLHLEPDYSFDLIEKAGFRLRNTPDHLIYKAVLRTLYRENMCTVQELLKILGCRELNVKEY